MAPLVSDMSISEDEKETILWKGRKFGNVAKVEVKKNCMSGWAVPFAGPRPKPIKISVFPEPTWKEVYAREQAARKKRERVLGIVVEEPDNEDDISVAEFQIKGKQRRWLDDRIYDWLEDVSESGFDEGQRKLSVEETKDWLRMGKKLKSVKLSEEAKSAGSWVGDKFYPAGFW